MNSNLTMFKCLVTRVTKHGDTFMFQVEVFWVVTLCSLVVGDQRFGGPCCTHLQGECLFHWSSQFLLRR